VGFVIPAEMNSYADWAKCQTTLRGNHLVNLGAKISKLPVKKIFIII